MVVCARRTSQYNKLGLVFNGFLRARRAPLTAPALALAAVAGFISVTPARAQNATVSSTIERAAEALGMVRGVRRRMDSINTVEFSGHGTLRIPESRTRWVSYDVTNMTVGISYYIPAMRWDETRRGPDGREVRNISVFRNDLAWNEAEPGVSPVPVADRVERRRRQIWLTPHGVIRAAAQAEAERPGSVKLGMQDGKTTLEVVVDGSPIVATLDAQARPERVAMNIEHSVLGRTRLEARYSDYVDWQLLDVYFPSRIIQMLDDQIRLDLTITEFFQNPYVIFPTPEQLTRSAP